MTATVVVLNTVIAVAAVLEVNADQQSVWHIAGASGLPLTAPREWPAKGSPA